MKALILTVLLAFYAIGVFAASDSTKRASLGVDGQLSLTTNFKAFFFSIGGATFRFNSKKASLVFILMPIIKMKKDPIKPFISPGFAAGVQLHFLKNKRFILSAPFYYDNAVNRWQFSAGLGYVFGRKKQA